MGIDRGHRRSRGGSASIPLHDVVVAMMVASPGGVIVVVLIAIVLIVLVFVVVVLIVIVSIAVVVVVMVVVAVGLERYIDAARLIRGKATESLVVGKDAVHLKFGESKKISALSTCRTV